MPALVLLAIAIVGEVIATSALKASAGFTRFYPTVVVVFGYAVAFYFLSLALDRIAVGLAYAIWAGGGIVLITLAAWAIYGQRPDAPAILGMSLIVAGVLIINVFSKTGGH